MSIHGWIGYPPIAASTPLKLNEFFGQQNAFCECSVNNEFMLYIGYCFKMKFGALYISFYLAYVYVFGLTGAIFFDHDDSYKVFGLNFACQC